MCWSAQVSAITAVFEALCFSVLARRRLPIDVAALPLLASVIVVEALEVVQHVYSEPASSMQSLPGSCSAANRAAMVAIFITVTAQPLLVNVLLCRTNARSSHASLFQFTRAASAVLWALYLLAYALGEAGFDVVPPELAAQRNWRLLFSHTTCAYATDAAAGRGHLQWSVRTSAHELLPNVLPYVLLGALPLAWHRPLHAAAVPVGWMWLVFFCLILRFKLNLGVAGSVWCYAGMTLFAYYLALPFFADRATGTGQPLAAGSGGASRRTKAA